MSLDRSLPGFKKQHRRVQILYLFLLGVLILSGGLYLRWDMHSRLKASAQNVLNLALTTAAELPGDAVVFLAANPQKTNSVEYQTLQDDLSHFIQINHNVSDINLYTQIDHELVAFVRGNSGSLPWTVDETDAFFGRPFTDGQPAVSEPVMRGGKWEVTVQAPIPDMETGKTVAVLAAVFTVQRWDALSVTHLILIALLILLLMLPLVVYHLEIQKSGVFLAQKDRLTQMNEELERMQDRFRSAQAMAKVGNWELDIKTQQMWVSEETLRIHGLPLDSTSLPIDVFRNAIIKEDLPFVDREMQSLVRGKEPFSMRFTIKRADDGSKRVLYSTATIEYDDQKKPQKIVGVIRDNTDFAQVSGDLIESEERFRKVFEQSPLGISLANPRTGKVLSINAKYLEIIGLRREDMDKVNWVQITHPDDRAERERRIERLLSGQINSFQLNKRYLRPDGSVVWVNLTVAAIRTEAGIMHLNMVEDINDRMLAQQALMESERSKASLISNLPGMIYRCRFDRDWTMEFVSENCYQLTGYQPNDLLGNRTISFNQIISPDDRERVWAQWEKALKRREKCELEYAIVTAKGKKKWVWEQGQGIFDIDGNVVTIEGLMIDITERKEKESRILYLSNHDILTDLYNRNFFEQEKARLDTSGCLPVSVIIGDINGLKLINDALGHAEGDKLLVDIAKILKKCCRKDDLVARTGGDEFTILLPRTSSDVAHSIMRRIYTACDENNGKVGGKPYYISISLGYSTKTEAEESQSLDDVLNEAQQFMYKRKLLELKSLHSTIISSMKATMLEKSHITEAHAERLAALSKAVGEALGLNDAQLSDLELLCTLHDIGKIGVDDHILQKPGKLTEEEWTQMRRHPEVGYRIAMATPELQSIAELILTHHERWDGKGYPQGLMGEFIPLLSRVLAVVDSYDAMTQDRPYRDAMAPEEAIVEIRGNAGTQYDPYIAQIFVEKVLGCPWEE